jgi:hypothetical protein
MERWTPQSSSKKSLHCTEWSLSMQIDVEREMQCSSGH